ncbi:MAG TPA: CHAD domain-containing protein [Bryobacteraceae bacterium]|jgi:CHAD domain-containing protein|nr:CHAD domain-containing protein [Bryobacteraceae bacterium]
MAYKFKQGQTVAQNVKRIASEELATALQCLRDRAAVPAESSVHEIRKSIKKTRALLRLVRPELGEFYADENVQLRDTGRKLSPLRDAGALIGVVDGLREHPLNGAGRSLSAVRKQLVRQKQLLEQEAGGRKLGPEVASELLRARKSVRYWRLAKGGFEALAPGIEKTFRDGRRALAKARNSGRREDFHEWRKRVKDLWYHVRLLEKIWGDLMEGYEHSLKELEDALGDDLNLAILTERVEAMASQNGGRLKAASLIKKIEDSRSELRKRTLEIGDRVYAEKPREFTRQMARLWKAWQS